MQTKYNTGQRILVPAIIRSARDENGVIMYEVDTEATWRGVREDAIVVDDRAESAAFKDTLERMTDRWR